MYLKNTEDLLPISNRVQGNRVPGMSEKNHTFLLNSIYGDLDELTRIN